MNVGLRFTEDSYQGYVYPASGYMDVGGAKTGQRSGSRLGRVFGWPDAIAWARAAHGLSADMYEIGNEPNLKVEHVFTRASYVAYAEACAAQAPSLVKVSAGISPSNDPQATQDGAYVEWYQACDAIPGLTYTGAHIYGRTLDELVALTDEILAATTRDIIISEINFGPAANFKIDRNVWAYSALRPYLLNYVRTQPRIKMVLYFAYLWQADFPIGTPVNASGTAILSVLSEAANLPTSWNIGPGFQKCVRDLGWTPLENELYHFDGDPTRKTSLAVFDLGHATWDPRSNETVAIANSGIVYSDGGNRPMKNGAMVQVWPPLS